MNEATENNSGNARERLAGHILEGGIVDFWAYRRRHQKRLLLLQHKTVWVRVKIK